MFLLTEMLVNGRGQISTTVSVSRLRAFIYIYLFNLPVFSDILLLLLWYITMPCMNGSSQMVQIVLHGCTDKSHQMNYSQERNVKQVLQTIHRFHNRFTITEKDPTRAFSLLIVHTSASTFKTLLRHTNLSLKHSKIWNWDTLMQRSYRMGRSDNNIDF